MNLNYIDLAIKEALKALTENEIPIGAVIVKNDQIIAKAHNLKNKTNDPTKHAEIIAIQKTSKKIKNWRLTDCDLYVTLFPCPMCASAIQQARIKNVYYVFENLDQKSVEISKAIFETTNTNRKVNYEKISNQNESLKLLQNFFKKKR